MNRIWNVNRRNLECHVLRKSKTWELDGKDSYQFMEADGEMYLVDSSENQYRVDVVRDEKSYWVHLKGISFYLEPHDWIGREDADAETSSGDVLAPMTGKVTKILVKVGDCVAEGDLVAEMEAMKMQYHVKATKDGRVAEILTKAGEVSNVDSVLMKIEQEEE